jgi:hypothetical protein
MYRFQQKLKIFKQQLWNGTKMFLATFSRPKELSNNVWRKSKRIPSLKTVRTLCMMRRSSSNNSWRNDINRRRSFGDINHEYNG